MGATRLLCCANAVLTDFDTEFSETREKPNRPSGRLMSARVTADSSKLGRCHSGRHQPSSFAKATEDGSVFGFIRVTEFRPAGEEHGF